MADSRKPTRKAPTSRAKPAGQAPRSAPAPRASRSRPALSGPAVVVLVVASLAVGLLAANNSGTLPAAWRQRLTVHPGGHVIGATPTPRADSTGVDAARETAPTVGSAGGGHAQPTSVPAKATRPATPTAAKAATRRGEDELQRATPGVLSPQERHSRLDDLELPDGFTSEWRGGAAVLSQDANELVRIDNGRKRVALTFDGCYEADNVPKLLETLASHNLRATFMLTGVFCRQFPEAVKKIAAAGMEIGNHTDTHPYLTKLSEGQIMGQLERAEKLLVGLAGDAYRPYFRPPYGDRNTRVLRLMIRSGFLPIYWTADTLDWQQQSTPASVTARIRSKGGVKPGAIILQHISSAASRDVLSDEIAMLREAGLEPGPLSALLRK